MSVKGDTHILSLERLRVLASACAHQKRKRKAYIPLLLLPWASVIRMICLEARRLWCERVDRNQERE